MTTTTHEDKKPTAYETWIDTFIDEKGFDLEAIVFEVEGPEWGTNFIPLGVVIEHIKIAPAKEKAAIKDMIVKIDFFNGDVLDFFKHLAKALAK